MDAENNSPKACDHVIKHLPDICFTWVPSPRFHNSDMKTQFDDTYKLLKKLSSCTSQCKVYPELTLAGNIHYHGLFNISDPIKWYKSVLPTLKRHGFVKVVKVREHIRDKWIQYIIKERDTMLNLLEVDEQLFDSNGLNLKYKRTKTFPINTEESNTHTPKWYDLTNDLVRIEENEDKTRLIVTLRI